MSTEKANRTAVIEFPDLESFYAARGGERSIEYDYGFYNVDDLGVNPVDPRPQPSWLRYQVSYVGETGDFYAVALGRGFEGKGRALLLGSLGAGHVEKDVHAHFEDWAEGEGLGRPLSWYVERIATYVPKRKDDLPAGVEKFLTLDDFYEGRGGGYSGESDYGKFNKNDLGVELSRVRETTETGFVFVPAGEPDYRVTYVHDTGDFYAVENRFDTSAEVVLLGSVGPGHEEPEVYVHFADWAGGDGPGRPFSWFVERIASYPGRTAQPDGG